MARISAVPGGTLSLSFFTRQFLPGYFQPRLPALSPGLPKILRQLNVSANVFCISESRAFKGVYEKARWLPNTKYRIPDDKPKIVLGECLFSRLRTPQPVCSAQ
jgi:hypothetical protein